MHIRTPLDLGLAIRERRRQLGLSQAELAARAGVGRQWLVAVEHGKPRAEIGLVLALLDALGCALTVTEVPGRTASAGLDAVIEAAKKVEP